MRLGKRLRLVPGFCVPYCQRRGVPFGMVRRGSGFAGRLDAFIGQLARVCSRSRAHKLISRGFVRVDGAIVKPSHRLKGSELISCWVPADEPIEAVPQDIPIDILYEDSDLVVVNKPRGMVVHPGAGNATGTLVNALLFRCGELAGIGAPVRPGIVHRIDKDTSGVLVVAKTDFAHASLAVQLAAHSVTRAYMAVVVGEPRVDGGHIEAPIGRHPNNRRRMAVVKRGGKAAVTNWRILECFRGYTLIEARLETGRTHQIRVHMAHIGYPLVADPVYGPAKTPVWVRKHLSGQALHAWLLGFVHPRSGAYMEFEAPLPHDMQSVVSHLRDALIL